MAVAQEVEQVVQAQKITIQLAACLSIFEQDTETVVEILFCELLILWEMLDSVWWIRYLKYMLHGRKVRTFSAVLKMLLTEVQNREGVTCIYNRHQSSLPKTMTPWGLGWSCLSQASYFGCFIGQQGSRLTFFLPGAQWPLTENFRSSITKFRGAHRKSIILTIGTVNVIYHSVTTHVERFSPPVTFWHLNQKGILTSSSHILILVFTAHWSLNCWRGGHQCECDKCFDMFIYHW